MIAQDHNERRPGQNLYLGKIDHLSLVNLTLKKRKYNNDIYVCVIKRHIIVSYSPQIFFKSRLRLLVDCFGISKQWIIFRTNHIEFDSLFKAWCVSVGL